MQVQVGEARRGWVDTVGGYSGLVGWVWVWVGGVGVGAGGGGREGPRLDSSHGFGSRMAASA